VTGASARHIRGTDTGQELVVRQDDAGWSYAALRVLVLDAGQTRELATGDEEMMLLPLSGGCDVVCGEERFVVDGRSSVFSRVSDFVYLPRDAEVAVTSAAGGRFALASARCERRLPARYGPAGQVPVETRGTGSCSRQVNNFGAAGVFEADRLIAVEVLTPGGNWSSYPPHKHDEERVDERQLEEIYYFELRGGPGAVGYQSTVDVLAEVRHGDTVLVPHGYHGPSMAPPGYDMYYLNVMAGPVREWRFRDDPAHAWIRGTWARQDPDPRLPFGGAR